MFELELFSSLTAVLAIVVAVMYVACPLPTSATANTDTLYLWQAKSNKDTMVTN